MSITVDQLRAELHYNPETGVFTRLRDASTNARKGSVAGHAHVKGYWHIGVAKRSYKAHRLAWFYMTGEWPAFVDHINGDRGDNRWANLRLVTNAQNCANARLRSDNAHGLKGVKPLNGRWQARIGAGGKIHLGTFDTPEEAHAAYCAAARGIYGEFARRA